MTAIQALADRVQPEDPRTADQRRADALTQLATSLLTGDTCGRLPSRQRTRPAVQVSVALSTLLGVDEQPGELAGHGPIPAALARRLAADPTGTWRRIVTDQHGRLLDYGRQTYRPPEDVTEHLTARDRTCRFPHCTRTATAASWTTSPRGPTAAPPTPRTCTSCARGTTTSSTRPRGRCDEPPTATRTGPAPPAGTTAPPPPPTPSTPPPAVPTATPTRHRRSDPTGCAAIRMARSRSAPLRAATTACARRGNRRRGTR
jgi:hypothetical protein